MKFHLHHLAIAFLMLIATSCNGILFGNDDCENVACTKEFKAISIRVEDANNNAVQLAGFKIYYTRSKVEISNLNNDQGFSPGYYFIANDGMLEDLKCNGTSITFSYSIDGVNYFDEKFLVGKDCCHVLWRDEKEPYIIVE